MTTRTFSRSSLKARIDTLRRRHREIDARITREESRPSANMLQIKQLKQERLGLRDAIRMTQSLMTRLQSTRIQSSWQSQFHSG
ncbi:MAG: YdcH family protein [Rhodobacteraceae bacterium]|jgi:hypothetical protein|nr:YdcH family protein [Paracoccaceae bacterium]